MPVAAIAQSGVQNSRGPSNNGAAPPAANTTGSCQPAKVKFASGSDVRQTTSLGFVGVAGATLSFTQGGKSPNCVIVYFSAEVDMQAGAQMAIRATLDNVPNAVPSQMNFAYNALALQAHSASFIFPNVAPGAHVLRIQYLSVNGKTVFISKSNTIIHFAE